MKIRNILSVLFVGLLSTTVTRKKKFSEEMRTGRISFSTSSYFGSDVMAKKLEDIAEGYTYSTEDGVKVNNVVVAIVNEANGDCG